MKNTLLFAILLAYGLLSYAAGIWTGDSLATTRSHRLENSLPQGAYDFWHEVSDSYESGQGIYYKSSGALLMGESLSGVVYTWCRDEFSCLHEVGHAIQMQFETVPPPQEFANALDDYFASKQGEPMCVDRPRNFESASFDCYMFSFPMLYGPNEGYDNWGGHMEFYADIYALWKLGKMEIPEELLMYWEGQ